MARALILTPILVLLALLAASAQGDVNSMRGRLEKRFQVLPIANGVVLIPRFKTEFPRSGLELEMRRARQ